MGMDIQFDAVSVGKCIIGGAEKKALLLGLLSSSLKSEVYVEEIYSTYRLVVVKRVLPNLHSRLDIMYVNGCVVGTILSSRLLPRLYHMVGMFVGEKFRKKMIEVTFPGYMKQDNHAPPNRLGVAAFLLRSFTEDILNVAGGQVSLEVMNGNIAAWMLYEKCKPVVHDGRDAGFELLSEEEVCVYGKLRGKQALKWYGIHTLSGKAGVGVQWTHVPNYGETTKEWSVNRVYLLKSAAESPLFLSRENSAVSSKLDAMVSIFRYGCIVGFFWSWVKSKWAKT